MEKKHMPQRLFRALGTALLATLALTSCGGGDTATVKRVIDGDTIEVEYQGKDATVRLLNIDTPETKHPNQNVECLGPEASQFLTNMLPEGTQVTLEFDKEKTDKYDRLLAGVYKEDGTFVNETIAKNGFATAIKIAPNEKFYSQILKAQEEALEYNRGIFDPASSCALPGMLREATQAVEEATSPEDLITAVEAALKILITLEEISADGSEEYLKNLLQSETVSSLIGSLKSALESRNRDYLRAVQTVESEAAEKEEAQRQAAEAERKAEEERKAAEAAEAQRLEAERAAQAEAERIAAEQVAAAQAEADRIAAEQAAEAERQRQAQLNQPPAPAPAPVPAPAPAPVPNPAPGQNQPAPPPAPAPAPEPEPNPYPGYTGPRCYAPGGKSWTPCPNR